MSRMTNAVSAASHMTNAYEHTAFCLGNQDYLLRKLHGATQAFAVLMKRSPVHPSCGLCCKV